MHRLTRLFLAGRAAQPAFCILHFAFCILALPAGAQEMAGPNLVANGGFEDAREGWGASLKRVEEPVAAGRHAAVLDNTANKEVIWIAQPFVPIQANRYYQFSMALRRTNGHGYVYAHCNWFKAPGERLMASKNWAVPRAVPATSRTGEGVGRWQTLTGVFRSTRAEVGGVQLVILLRGDDVVYVDDVSIREVRYPEAPAWRFPEAVLFPGHPSKFGMAVESAIERAGRFQVATTGARYTLDAKAGTLMCAQRVGTEREVALVQFAEPLGPLRLAKKDRDACVVQGADVAFGFQGDSLVAIATNRTLKFSVTARIGAKHFRTADPHLLAIDEAGGFCVMPHAPANRSTPGSAMAGPEGDTARPGWKVEYTIGAREMAGVAVFPGRPFDWEKSFRKRIVNTRDCPPAEALAAFRKASANILFLFAGIYVNHPGGDCHAPYTVREPAQLRETVAAAHRLGMQVICYRHPTSYEWSGQSIDEALADMRAARKEYGFDGWYLDGLFDWVSWMNAYRAMRILRDDVGSGPIYSHCTINPPAGMTEIYCPFIDAYSDFLLRGEGQSIAGPADPYLRYVINTVGISNSIATLKGDKMQAEAGGEKGASLRQQLDVMLRLNGRCRWAYPAWPFGARDKEDYLGFYFAELDRQQAEWERTRKPPVISDQ